MFRLLGLGVLIVVMFLAATPSFSALTLATLSDTADPTDGKSSIPSRAAVINVGVEKIEDNGKDVIVLRASRGGGDLAEEYLVDSINVDCATPLYFILDPKITEGTTVTLKVGEHGIKTSLRRGGQYTEVVRWGKGRSKLEVFLHSEKATPKDRQITIVPAPRQVFTPILSYIFGANSKPSYGIAQPLFTIPRTPFRFGIVVSSGADEQQSFIGGALVHKFYLGSRATEDVPEWGSPISIDVAAGFRGWRIGQGNPGNELFYMVGLSAYLESDSE